MRLLGYQTQLMFRSDIEIKNGAVFVADAHYSKSKPHFLDFIKKIQKKDIKTTQLFLMGDIFDALFGYVPYTYEKNKELVDAINSLAKEIEIVYLEGNHDFQLHRYFKNINIFPIKKHPVEVRCVGKKVWLSHGDFDAPFGYRAYTFFIRNKAILPFLNIYDRITNHSILNFVDRHMSKKDECKELEWFKEFSLKRIKNGFECDVYIDGHFHQNKKFDIEGIKYINLGAFACNQRYFVVEYINEEKSFDLKERFL